MRRETIKPDSREHWLQLRAADITSSEVAALFNLCPYMTAFELWHLKKENIEQEEIGGKRITWGTRMEDAIAYGVAEDHELIVRPMKEYIRLAELGIGASFDYRIQIGAGDGPDDELLEIKNVDYLIFRDKWIVDKAEGYIEAPPHIEFQVQHQMLVSGLKKGRIAAFIGGNDVVIAEREANPKIQQAILDKCAAFWESIDNDQPPEPDLNRDASLIVTLAGHAEPGSIFNADGNERMDELVAAYQEGMDKEKEGAAQKERCKAEIVTIIGDAEKVIGDGYSISAGMVAPCEVAYTRKGYRQFRVYSKKEK